MGGSECKSIIQINCQRPERLEFFCQLLNLSAKQIFKKIKYVNLTNKGELGIKMSLPAKQRDFLKDKGGVGYGKV